MASVADLLLILVGIVAVLNGDNCTMIPAGSTVNIIEPVTIGETVANHCIIKDGNAVIYSCPHDGHIGTMKMYANNTCEGDPDIYDVEIAGECYSDLCIGYNDVES